MSICCNSDLKQGVICLDDHMSHCFSAEMHQVFVMVATDAKHFINDLCDNPDVQRRKQTSIPIESSY